MSAYKIPRLGLFSRCPCVNSIFRLHIQGVKNITQVHPEHDLVQADKVIDYWDPIWF